MVRLNHFGRSDVGMIRTGNEDNWAAEANERRGVFIVADGMGGHAAGEVASEMAVQLVLRDLREIAEPDGPEAGQRIDTALRNANRKIHDRTITETDKQGM